MTKTIAAIVFAAVVSSGCATTTARSVPDNICTDHSARIKEARMMCIENDPFDDFEECTVAAVEMLSDMFCGTQH
ncbi:MAG: hypothetical protein V2I26_06770 [Halieaceae bacterium]|jgi:hypothetical protein|nr:hypothetical protein [Halieaceae bacterium]